MHENRQINAFKMVARLNIHCSHPAAADPILYVEGIDLNWTPPRLRNHVFDVRNLNGVVRLPEDLSFHHFGTIENPMGEPLDRNRSLTNQGIVSEGYVYMVVRLMGPAAGPRAGGAAGGAGEAAGNVGFYGSLHTATLEADILRLPEGFNWFNDPVIGRDMYGSCCAVACTCLGPAPEGPRPC